MGEPMDYHTTGNHQTYNDSDYSSNYYYNKNNNSKNGNNMNLSDPYTYQVQQVTSNAPLDTFDSNVPYYTTNTATSTTTGDNKRKMNRRSTLLVSLNSAAV